MCLPLAWQRHVLGWGRGLLLVSFSSLWLRMSLLLSCYATLSWLLARWVHFLDSNRAEHVLLGSVQIAELRSCEKMVPSRDHLEHWVQFSIPGDRSIRSRFRMVQAV